jgi:antitoxin HicB
MKRKLRGIDHNGSSFDDFLREEGTLEEAEAVAIKRVIAWQLQQEMQQQRISKKAMANRLRTSRSQLDRLLDPKNSGVTLDTLSRAAMALGKRLKVQVIDGPERTLRKRPGRVGLGPKSCMVSGRK